MSTWAYQVENIEPSPDEDLVCSICQGVFNDPVQSLCPHVFCRSCLSKWILRSPTCPVCRQTVSTRTIRSDLPLVHSLISKLRVKCPACVSDPMSIEDAGKHLCPEACVRCLMCRVMVKRSLLMDHQRRICPQRHKQCYKCLLKLPSRASLEPKHNCIGALMKKLKEKTRELRITNRQNRELQGRIDQLEEERAQYPFSSRFSFSDEDNMSDSSLSNDDDMLRNRRLLNRRPIASSIESRTSSGEVGDVRMREFRSLVANLLRERQAQSVPLDDLNQYVISNGDQQQPFTQEVISAALDIMTEANQVMVANNIVFLI